jgi:uncharacterized membrane protein YidH (DUF202 family)
MHMSFDLERFERFDMFDLVDKNTTRASNKTLNLQMTDRGPSWTKRSIAFFIVSVGNITLETGHMNHNLLNESDQVRVEPPRVSIWFMTKYGCQRRHFKTLLDSLRPHTITVGPLAALTV